MGSGYPPPTWSRLSPLRPDIGGIRCLGFATCRQPGTWGWPGRRPSTRAVVGSLVGLLAESAERTDRQLSPLTSTGAIPEALDTGKCRGLRLSGAVLGGV